MADEQNKENFVPQSRLNEVITERNELKQKIQEFETFKTQIEADKKKREEGEYKTLITKLQSELEEKSKLANEYLEYQKNKRETLTEKLPETHRKFVDGMNLTALEEFVNVTLGEETKTDTKKPPRPGSSTQPVNEKEWRDMTTAEKQAYIESKAN